MKEFGAVLLSVKAIFDIPLTIDGITFSFWQIFLWMIVAGVVVWLLLKWIGD